MHFYFIVIILRAADPTIGMIFKELVITRDFLPYFTTSYGVAFKECELYKRRGEAILPAVIKFMSAHELVVHLIPMFCDDSFVFSDPPVQLSRLHHLCFAMP